MKTFESILSRVTEVTGVARSEILSHSRRPAEVDARLIVYAALRRQGMSYPRISEACLRKSKNTAFYGCRRAQMLSDTDPSFRQTLQRCTSP